MQAERKIGNFGATLREARERRGLSLRQIANDTKISVALLEALERNDVSRLPGGIFSRSFVRSYASEVGLDPELTVEDFVRQFPDDMVVAGHHQPQTRAVDEDPFESNQRAASAVLRLLLLSVPIAGFVIYLSTTSYQPAPAIETDAPLPVVGNDITLPPELPVPSALIDRLLIEVVASRPCVVSAIVDGQALTETRLAMSTRRTFDAQRELVLTVSDPSAIELMVNGVPGRSLGPRGDPVTVRITLDNYRTYLAAQ